MAKKKLDQTTILLLVAVSFGLAGAILSDMGGYQNTAEFLSVVAAISGFLVLWKLADVF